REDAEHVRRGQGNDGGSAGAAGCARCANRARSKRFAKREEWIRPNVSIDDTERTERKAEWNAALADAARNAWWCCTRCRRRRRRSSSRHLSSFVLHEERLVWDQDGVRSPNLYGTLTRGAAKTRPLGFLST